MKIMIMMICVRINIDLFMVVIDYTLMVFRMLYKCVCVCVCVCLRLCCNLYYTIFGE